MPFEGHLGVMGIPGTLCHLGTPQGAGKIGDPVPFGDVARCCGGIRDTVAFGDIMPLGTAWGGGKTGVTLPPGDTLGFRVSWRTHAIWGHLRVLGRLGTPCHLGTPWGAGGPMPLGGTSGCQVPHTGEQTQALGPPHPVPPHSPPPAGGALTVSPQKPSAICARLELCPGEPGGVLAVPPRLGAPGTRLQVGAAGGICGVSIGGVWGQPYRVLYGHLGASMGYLGASTGVYMGI